MNKYLDLKKSMKKAIDIKITIENEKKNKENY